MLVRKNTNFTKIREKYEKNKNRPWKEWLKISEVFSNLGKQGVVGSATIEDETVIFKFSQYMNYLVQHEITVMKDLNTLAPYCPHFCGGVGAIICDVNSASIKEKPFEKAKHTIEKEVLLMEPISKAHKLLNYINTEKFPEHVIFSVIKQVLLAVWIAQKKCEFTHYDLHSKNILLKRCDKNTIFLYVIDENTVYAVPTYGYYPIIIDYGFSYTKSIGEGYLWPSLGFTDIGFYGCIFDPVADPKLFLLSVSSDIIDARKTKNSKKFRRIANNIYSCLNVNRESGWDNMKESLADYATKYLKKYNDCSLLFKEYDAYFIDIVQSLIILPLEKRDYSNIHVSFITFLNEFSKIENIITSPFYCLYVLKGIVDIARNIREDYVRKETRKQAVKYFMETLHEYTDSVAEFCKIENLHYERMLCALYCFSRELEGLYFDRLQKRLQVRDKYRKKLSLESIEEIYAAIDINIPDEYSYTENDTIIIMDADKEKSYEKRLSIEDCEEINSYESIYQGKIMYEKICSNKENV